ncbi:Sec62/63 complex, subunit Sec66 [Xylaria arbuscula]|nr:Sec62/63 complex, subunit Sec66 [Xylaria arbuscula]
MYNILDIDWTSLALPFAYITVLGGSLYTFSTVYRKRKAVQSANLEPWFQTHLQRDVYLTLLDMQPEPGEEKGARIPDSVIRAALLRRAVEDIRRIIQIRTSKQALTTLIQRGSVGDELLHRFQAAEKEIEEELRDVVSEANALAPGWGNSIFQSANEIAANTALRSSLEKIEGHLEADKQWWEKRRETIKEDFMKELEEDSAKGSAKAVSDDDVVHVEQASPAATPSKKKKKGKN